MPSVRSAGWKTCAAFACGALGAALGEHVVTAGSIALAAAAFVAAGVAVLAVAWDNEKAARAAAARRDGRPRSRP